MNAFLIGSDMYRTRLLCEISVCCWVFRHRHDQKKNSERYEHRPIRFCVTTAIAVTNEIWYRAHNYGHSPFKYQKFGKKKKIRSAYSFRHFIIIYWLFKSIEEKKSFRYFANRRMPENLSARICLCESKTFLLIDGREMDGFPHTNVSLVHWPVRDLDNFLVWRHFPCPSKMMIRAPSTPTRPSSTSYAVTSSMAKPYQWHKISTFIFFFITHRIRNLFSLVQP